MYPTLGSTPPTLTFVDQYTFRPTVAQLVVCVCVCVWRFAAASRALGRSAILTIFTRSIVCW